MSDPLSSSGASYGDEHQFVDIRYDVLGVPVSMVTMDEAVRRLEVWAKDRIGRFVCVRDVASLMAIAENPRISGLHGKAAMIVPDGMPLVWIGKRRGLAVERVSGPDLFNEMMSRGQLNGLKHYFYGGKPGIASRLEEQVRRRFPGINIVGTESPAFGEISAYENDITISRILDSGADIVWVGMSSPKQDVWMAENYHKFSATMVGVGAAFDFHSGMVKRAPVWMQKSGLEWLYRLSQEPRRLWRRYLVSAPLFVLRTMVWRRPKS